MSTKISKIKMGLKQAINHPPVKARKIDVSKLIPTGSTTFNLECSGRIEGAFLLGKIVNLIGDSHSGKCIKETYTLTSKGMEKIDHIGKDKPFGASPYIEKLTTSKGVKDITSHFWKETVSRTIEIKTKQGYSLKGTKNHPIMVFNSDFTFQMKKLKHILPGDCVVIARGAERFSNEYVKIPIVNGTTIERAIIPKVINKQFARLLGYIVACGRFSTNSIHISNTKKYVIDDINKICKSLNVKFIDNRIISSKSLWKTMLEIFDNPKNFIDQDKQIPECVLMSPKSIQAAFLRALMDCASSGDTYGIYYNTTSKELAKQIHLMLLNFGIIASLKFKSENFINGVDEGTYWCISFYANELNIYRKNIGSNKYIIPKKAKFCDSDYDSIPNLIKKMKADIDQLQTTIGRNKNKHYAGVFPKINFTDSVNGSKKILKKFIRLFEDTPIDLSLYKYIDKSGYYFDTIEKVTYSEEETIVYDVHIPKTHLFWSNGFISHNTLFALTIFAECSLLSKFDNFRFIYDDVEAANEFDIAYLFGNNVNKRIEQDKRSKTIEEFNDTLARLLSEEKPFIYVLDSFDGLTSEAAMEKDESNRKAREKGNKISGSYGDGKPKKASEMFSQRVQQLYDHGSFLLIVSQTRANIGFGSMFTPKTRSGGKALKFYSCHEVWLACQKKETYSTNVKAKITKNKLTGRHGEAEFPILFDYGVDNITSCIKFLLAEKVWSGTTRTINSKGFAKQLSLSLLIKHIEENDLENDLFLLCQKTYDQIIEKLKPNRKRKY